MTAQADYAYSAWAENWAERAAILEFEAGMTREQAEKEADRICRKPEIIAETAENTGLTPLIL